MNETTKTSVDKLSMMIDDVCKLFADRNLLRALMLNRKGEIIKIVTSSYKDEIINIIAIEKGISADEYSASTAELFTDLMSLLNNKALTDFFSSQVQQAQTSVGSATANTKETGTTKKHSSATSKQKVTKKDTEIQ